MRKMMTVLAAPLSVGLLMSTSAMALAQNSDNATTAETNMSADGDNQMSNETTASTTSEEGDVADAQDIVREAGKVVGQMRNDEQVAQLLDKAKGVYIVPDFGRAGFVIGGKGGAGAMLAHRNGSWSSPAFYDFGSISLGAQAGASAGSVAFLLMTDDAVEEFQNGNNFSLNGEAGLSIINYSANSQGSYGKGDVVFWSDTEGAYAGATVSASDISFDEENTKGYYGKAVQPSDVLSGKVSAEQGDKLQSALSG